MKTWWSITMWAVCLFASAIQAQPLADKVPADALVYIGWTGTEALPAGYAGSNLKQVLAASDMGALCDTVLPQIFDKIADREPQSRQVMRVLKDMAPMVLRHPSAFYLGDIKFQTPDLPLVGAVLCRAGPDAQKLELAVKEGLALAGEPATPIEVAVNAGLVVVSIGEPGLATKLARGAGDSLKANPAAVAAFKQTVADPVIAGYINGSRIWSLIDQATQPRRRDAEKWAQVRQALGLAGLRQAAWASGFEGKEWVSAAFIDAPAPRTGLAAMLASGPLSEKAMELVPASAALAVGVKFDPAKLVEQTLDAIGQVEPRGRQEVEQGLDQVSQMLGMDVRRDLLASLGDEWTIYTDARTAGAGVLGLVMVAPVRDAAKVTQALDRIGMIAVNVANQKMGGDAQLSIRTVKIEGVDARVMSVPMVAPNWAIKDGRLYVTLYPQTLAGALRHEPGKSPSLATHAAFNALRKRLGATGASMYGYMDLPQTAGDSYQAILMLSQMYLGMGSMFLGVEVPPMVLPPLHAITPVLAPAMGAGWVDDAGLHVRNIEPFPGSTQLGSSTNVMFAQQAMMLGMLMPALSSARSSANAMTSPTQVRRLLGACMQYADNRNDRLPDTLGDVLADGQVEPELFLSPNSTDRVPPEFASWPIARRQQWVNQNSSYVWVGAGQMHMVNADAILLYEHPRFARNGRIAVGWGDAHVTTIPVDEVMRKVAQQQQKQRPPR